MPHHNQGASLTELLICIFIVLVTCGISMPNYAEIIAKSRIDTHLSKYEKALMLGRLTAIDQQTFVTICPLVDGACAQQWKNNVFLFIDHNGNKKLDESDVILIELDAVFANDEFSYPRDAITYRGDGSIAFMQSGSFIYCIEQFPHLNGNRLSVSQVGRVRIRDTKKCVKEEKKEE